MASPAGYSDCLTQPTGFLRWASYQEPDIGTLDGSLGRWLVLRLPPRASASVMLAALGPRPAVIWQPIAWAAVRSVEWNQLSLWSGYLVLECEGRVYFPGADGQPAASSMALLLDTSPARRIMDVIQPALARQQSAVLMASDLRDRIDIAGAAHPMNGQEFARCRYANGAGI